MNHSKKRRFLLPVITVILSGMMLRSPQLCAQGFESGLRLCVNTVLPALFPFFVFCDLWMSAPLQGRATYILAHLFGLRQPAGATAVLISWVGGYAVCARLTGQLYHDRKIHVRDATVIMMLGCCSSPGFVVGCVGGLLLGNPRLGALLYGLQLGANLLSTAICIPFLPHPAGPGSPSEITFGDGRSLPQAISAAVENGTQVCSCILFFRTIGAVISPYLPHIAFSFPLLSAILEISAGCTEFSRLGGSYALYGCCFCLSLLGVSVWTQIALLLRGAVPLRLLLANRCVHLAVFLFSVRLLARLLPGTQTVYSTLTEQVILMQRLPLDAACITFLFICSALYKVRQNFYNE